MSRIEAAAKAARYENRREHPTTASRVTAIAVVSVAAADAHDAAHGIHRVSLDEGTVERAAVVLRDMTCCQADCQCSFSESERYRDVTRAVLAAAVKEDG